MTLKLATAAAVIVFVSFWSAPQPVASLALSEPTISNTESSMVVKPSAMKIFRDQVTGENLEESQDMDEAYSSRAMIPTGVELQSPSFEERPSDIEGGGMVVELNGFFNSHMKASIDPDSRELHTHCNHDKDS